MYLIENVNSGQNYKINSFEKKILSKQNSVLSKNLVFGSERLISEANVPSKGIKKGLIAAGIAFVSTLAVVSTVVITRGRNKKLANKALAEIPDELKTIFAKLKNEEGEAFFNKGYQQIKKFMKLEDIAPEKVIINANETSGFSIKGGFSPHLNSINYDNGVLKMNKVKQLDMLAHELKHSEQFSLMIRTEGVGIETLAEALAENAVKSSISKSSFNFFFRNAYQNAVREGKAEAFLAAAKKNTAKTFLEELRVNYEKVLNLPKISSDSIEGIKALEKINAIKDYEGANLIGIAGDIYKNNPLEVEAYAFGEKISNYFEKFMKYQKYYKSSV